MKSMSREEARDTTPVPRCCTGTENRASGPSEGPSAFLMCAFFLGLASVAVVVVGGHFPWFILAPLLVLLMFVHVRRIEAKYQRKPESAR